MLSPDRPGPLPRLAPLPEPQDAPGGTAEAARFLATAWVSAARLRWPQAVHGAAENWFRKPAGKHFMKAAALHLRAHQIPAQAWVGFVLAAAPRTLTPMAPDIGLASNHVAARLGAYRAWRSRTVFALPAASLGGDWAEAHNRLVVIEAKLRALDAALRQAGLDVDPSVELVSRIVDAHLPNWRDLYTKVAARVAELDRRAVELVAEGTFIWAPVVR